MPGKHCPHGSGNKRKCEECRALPDGILAKKRAFMRSRSRKWRAADLCTQCGGSRDSEFKICTPCRARLRDMTEQRRLDRRANGMCVACGLGAPRSDISPFCDRCFWLNKGRGIRKKHGVDPSFILDMYEAQDKCCVICQERVFWLEGRRTMKTTPSVACIDHCHKTGQVRGILCSKCNSALGHFGDDISVMRRAISYLSGTYIEKFNG